MEPDSAAINFSRPGLPREVDPLALDVMAGQSTDDPRVHTLVILSSDGVPLVTEQFTSLVEFYRRLKTHARKNRGRMYRYLFDGEFYSEPADDEPADADNAPPVEPTREAVTPEVVERPIAMPSSAARSALAAPLSAAPQARPPNSRPVVAAQPPSSSSLQTILNQPVSQDTRDVLAVAQLAHHMLCDSYARAAQVQAQALGQVNEAVQGFLANNQRLAEQTCHLQDRFQEAMESVDLLEAERRMLEYQQLAHQLQHQQATYDAEMMAMAHRQYRGSRWSDFLDGVLDFFVPQDQDTK